MSSTSFTAADVMDKSASLMNDTAKTVYTHTAQLPYLNIALAEIEEHFQLNNISLTNETSVPIVVPVGTKLITPVDGIGAGPAPNYPDNLVEIQGLYERSSGSNDPFIPMVKREYLPPAINNMPTDSLQYWSWQNQQITFIGALLPREVRIDYIRNLFSEITNPNDVIGIINAKSFLAFRTAALCSEFIGENKSRADSLNEFAVAAGDRVTGIGIKTKQSITTRRRPFMAAYKRRSFA